MWNLFIPGEDKDAEMFSILGLIPTENTKENSDKFKIRKPVLKNDTAVKWTRPDILSKKMSKLQNRLRHYEKIKSKIAFLDIEHKKIQNIMFWILIHKKEKRFKRFVLLLF